MKKIGFFGLAEATTVNGEVAVAPSDGLEIVSGKSFEAAGGGTCAGGAGSGLVCGDHVIGTGGVEGTVGGGGLPVGDVVVVVFGALLPQPARTRLAASHARRSRRLLKRQPTTRITEEEEPEETEAGETEPLIPDPPKAGKFVGTPAAASGQGWSTKTHNYGQVLSILSPTSAIFTQYGDYRKDVFSIAVRLPKCWLPAGMRLPKPILANTGDIAIRQWSERFL